MDNDNKIEESTESDVLLFLKEELVPLRQKKNVTVYDLEKEYAKTKANRNISIWITLALTFVVVCLVTWGVVHQVSKTDTVDVTLDAFEDLNLKNLFDSLTKTQNLYEQASKTRAELQAASDARLLQAVRTRDSDLEYIKKLGLTKKARLEREQKILSRHSDAVARIHEEFDEKLLAAEAELKQYEEQLRSFDSENVAKAQEWEKQMDSQRQVHEIEKNQLTEAYETQIEDLKKQMADNEERSYKEKRTALNDMSNHYEARIAKLDPVIKDGKINSIIQRTSADASGTDMEFNPEAIAASVKYMDEDYLILLNALKSKFDDYQALSAVASGVPYKNGMAGLVAAENRLAYDLIFGPSIFGAEIISKVKTENAQLTNQVEKIKNENTNLRSALDNSNALLDAYAVSEKVDGFILNVSETGEIMAYIQKDKRVMVKNDGSTRVSVMADKKTKVGSGAVWFRNNVYYISLDEPVEISSGMFIKMSEK